MIHQSTLDFLSDLRRNNYREWFHNNRPGYEAARANVLDTASQIVEGMAAIDPSIGYPDLRKCTFRIARDTRFSADKSPYKDNIGVVFNADGSTRSPLSSYYIHISPGHCFTSCGAYMPERDHLRAIREAINDDWRAFETIVTTPAFRKRFGGLAREGRILQRVPTGFDKESPAAEYLKMTGFYAYRDYSDAEVCSPGFVAGVLADFRALRPLSDFLNRAIRGE